MARRRLTGRSIACAGLVCAIMLAGSVLVAQEAAPTSTPAAEVVVQDANVAAEGEKEDADRKRKLRLAILTGGLIAVTGLALVIFTILGGSATRRRLRRKPLTEGVPPLEPIPAERFDDREPAAHDDGQDAGSNEGYGSGGDGGRR
jgi:hypothetical protein